MKRLSLLFLLLLGTCACDLPTGEGGFAECMSPSATYEPTDRWVRVFDLNGTGAFTCAQVTYKSRK